MKTSRRSFFGEAAIGATVAVVPVAAKVAGRPKIDVRRAATIKVPWQIAADLEIGQPLPFLSHCTLHSVSAGGIEDALDETLILIVTGPTLPKRTFGMVPYCLGYYDMTTESLAQIKSESLRFNPKS